MIYITVAVKEELPGRPLVEFKGERCKVIHTGVGKANAAFSVASAIFEKRPSLIINIGTAGSNVHRVGQIISCSRFRDYDSMDSVGEIKFDLPSRFRHLQGNSAVYTSDKFFTDALFDIEAADMEAFAIAQVCKEHRVPFVSIKYITDIIGSNSEENWSKELNKAGEALRGYLSSVSI